MARYSQFICNSKGTYWNSLKLQQVEKLKIKNTIPRPFYNGSPTS